MGFELDSDGVILFGKGSTVPTVLVMDVLNIVIQRLEVVHVLAQLPLLAKFWNEKI